MGFSRLAAPRQAACPPAGAPAALASARRGARIPTEEPGGSPVPSGGDLARRYRKSGLETTALQQS